MKGTFWSWVAEAWCLLMHPAPMWPAHGYYRCPSCRRQYAVPWEKHRIIAVPQGVPATSVSEVQEQCLRIFVS